MRHFKILIVLALLAASSSFSATGKIILGSKAKAISPTFVGYDRPFHFGVNDTGLTVAQNDTLLFYANSNRGLFAVSDFNSNIAGTNSTVSSPYAGWVTSRQDSIICGVSYTNVDADSASFTASVLTLDHGSTYYTLGSSTQTVLNATTARARIAVPKPYSGQYFLKLITTTATDTLRVYRVVCGDK